LNSLRSSIGEDVYITLSILGLVCLMAAIIGGGLKAFGVEIPPLPSVIARVFLGVFGIGLIVVAVKLSADEQGKAPPIPIPDTAGDNQKRPSTPRAPVPRVPAVPLVAGPLSRTTVEVWYSENGSEFFAIQFKKRLESAGAKVSLKLSNEHPILGTNIIYYRDPSKLEAAIEAEELLRDNGIQGHSGSTGSLALRTDLLIIVTPMP
jgi:hypothetical protein